MNKDTSNERGECDLEKAREKELIRKRISKIKQTDDEYDELAPAPIQWFNNLKKKFSSNDGNTANTSKKFLQRDKTQYVDSNERKMYEELSKSIENGDEERSSQIASELARMQASGIKKDMRKRMEAFAKASKKYDDKEWLMINEIMPSSISHIKDASKIEIDDVLFRQQEMVGAFIGVAFSSYFYGMRFKRIVSKSKFLNRALKTNLVNPSGQYLKYVAIAPIMICVSAVHAGLGAALFRYFGALGFRLFEYSKMGIYGGLEDGEMHFVNAMKSSQYSKNKRQKEDEQDLKDEKRKDELKQ